MKFAEMFNGGAVNVSVESWMRRSPAPSVVTLVRVVRSTGAPQLIVAVTPPPLI
jgi:hypothetical protein